VIVAVTSDWHLKPGMTVSRVPLAPKPDLVVLNGDMRDVLPLGMDAWRTMEGQITIRSLAYALRNYKVVDILGNHEGRFSWLLELDKGTHFSPQRNHTIYAQIGLPYRFEHGYKFTEWRWLGYIADDVVELLTTHPWIRQWWYDFSIEMGWLPSKFCNPNPTPKYHHIVGLYWWHVFKHALKYKRNYVVGHSHCKAFLNTPHEMIPNVIDVGAGEWIYLEIK